MRISRYAGEAGIAVLWPIGFAVFPLYFKLIPHHKKYIFMHLYPFVPSLVDKSLFGFGCTFIHKQDPHPSMCVNTKPQADHVY